MYRRANLSVLFAAVAVLACGDEAPNDVIPPVEPLPDPPVMAAIRIVPPLLILPVFDSVAVRVEALDGAGLRIDDDVPVSWRVDSTDVVEMKTPGVLTALRIGEAALTATIDGMSAAVVTIVSPGVATIVISADSLLLGEGAAERLSAVSFDLLGREIPGQVFEWSARAGGVVDVSQEGVVTALRPGVGGVFATAPPSKNRGAVAVRVVRGFEHVLASRSHTCALAMDGELYCWGNQRYGRLGIGDPVDDPSSRPLPVAGGHRFREVAMGMHFTCGLTLEDTVLCWGWNGQAQLGRPPESLEGSCCALVPTPIDSDLRFATLAAGDAHACAVSIDGDAYCWGMSWAGQLGSATHPGWPACGMCAVFTPTLVEGGLPFQKVGIGGRDVSCGLSQDRAYCWGRGALGTEELDERCVGLSCPVPVRVATDETFTVVRPNLRHPCGLTSAGAVFCWDSAPHRVNGLPPVRFLGPAPVARWSCAIDEHDAAHCWDIQPVDAMVATPVVGGLRLKSISTSLGQTWHVACGVTTAHVPYCWPGDPRTTMPVRVPDPAN